MPEIGSYNQADIRGPVVRKNNIEDRSVVNKTIQADPLKGIEIQSNERLRIDEEIRRARNRGNPGSSFRGDLGQRKFLATVRDFEFRPGPGARQEGGLGPEVQGGPLRSPAGPAGLGINSIGASGGLREPQGVGVFQQIIDETIPDDLQAERAEAADRFSERVDRSIDTLNKRMEDLGRSVRFSKDREFDREVITVVNPDSGDIVRQIPPEYAIRVSEGLKSLRGLLFDDKA
ncbi:MAG: flagellar protein FlaG [Burkholderiaceae bacterium]